MNGGDLQASDDRQERSVEIARGIGRERVEEAPAGERPVLPEDCAPAAVYDRAAGLRRPYLHRAEAQEAAGSAGEPRQRQARPGRQQVGQVEKNHAGQHESSGRSAADKRQGDAGLQIRRTAREPAENDARQAEHGAHQRIGNARVERRGNQSGKPQRGSRTDARHD